MQAKCRQWINYTKASPPPKVWAHKKEGKKNMTTKEIKELALQILNRNGETGIKKSDFTVRQAKQLIKEYNLGWMK